jgi:hypothetical protein
VQLGVQINLLRLNELYVTHAFMAIFALQISAILSFTRIPWWLIFCPALTARTLLRHKQQLSGAMLTRVQEALPLFCTCGSTHNGSSRVASDSGRLWTVVDFGTMSRRCHRGRRARMKEKNGKGQNLEVGFLEEKGKKMMGCSSLFFSMPLSRIVFVLSFASLFSFSFFLFFLFDVLSRTFNSTNS